MTTETAPIVAENGVLKLKWDGPSPGMEQKAVTVADVEALLKAQRESTDPAIRKLLEGLPSLDQESGNLSLSSKTWMGLPIMDAAIGGGIAIIGGSYVIPMITNLIPVPLPPNLKKAGVELGLAWAAFKFGKSNNWAKVAGIVLTVYGLIDAAGAFIPQLAQRQDDGGVGGGLNQFQPTTPIALSRNMLAGV